MLINGKHHYSIEYIETAEELAPGLQKGYIRIIDQRFIPFQLIFEELHSSSEVIKAIREMYVRGAPLIGITAAFGVVFACEEALSKSDTGYLVGRAKEIIAARPTAVNAEHCVHTILKEIKRYPALADQRMHSLAICKRLMQEDIETCRSIGQHGLQLIKELSRKKSGAPVNILTHCNAGWLACLDYGTATAPIYLAKEEGIAVHVWVDETRPRNQGARLTVWELTENNVPNTLITDNAGGHLMQKGMVDMVIVGSDRTTLDGHTANKIGTYLKALAAYDNNIPFWVALPSTTIDRQTDLNAGDIPIEKRSEKELKYIEGTEGARLTELLITTKDAVCFNPGFDVTPARLITGLITEKGCCKADRESIYALFPEFRQQGEKS